MNKNYFYAAIIPVIISFSTTELKDTKKTVLPPVVEDQCSEWYNSSGHSIQFRWCKDPQLYNETSYQFYNGYSFKVWFYCRIKFTNGESVEKNTILDGGEQSDKGALYKRIPNSWNIYKKQKKDETGRWVDF